MGVLPYDSAHSKLAKQCIVLTRMSAALAKSCVYSASHSFEHQVTGLEMSGYAITFLMNVAESLQKALKNSEKHHNDMQPKNRVVIIPYISRVSHNLVGAAQKYRVCVVFAKR